MAEDVIQPSTGQLWLHRNGNEYVVLMVTNLPDEEHYPKTVVYQNTQNKTLWSRRADDWHRSFKPKLGKYVIGEG